MASFVDSNFEKVKQLMVQGNILENNILEGVIIICNNNSMFNFPNWINNLPDEVFENQNFVTNLLILLCNDNVYEIVRINIVEVLPEDVINANINQIVSLIQPRTITNGASSFVTSNLSSAVIGVLPDMIFSNDEFLQKLLTLLEQTNSSIISHAIISKLPNNENNINSILKILITIISNNSSNLTPCAEKIGILFSFFPVSAFKPQETLETDTDDYLQGGEDPRYVQICKLLFHVCDTAPNAIEIIYAYLPKYALMLIIKHIKNIS